MPVPRIRSIKGNLANLLAITDYNSIKSLMKAQPDLSTRKRAEEYLLENYADFVDNVQKIEKEQKQKEKKEVATRKKANTVYRNQNKKIAQQLMDSFNVEDEREKRMKPTINESSRFKTVSQQFQIENPENLNGFKSLSILNSAIPNLRKAIQEYKGMRVGFAFRFEMERDDTEKDGKPQKVEFPHVAKLQTILNINDIKTIIEDVKTSVRNFIPELETQKSGWRFIRIIDLFISISKYSPISGSSYLPLDKYIENKKCCINIKNEDDKCLMYCVLYHIHQKEIIKDSYRVSKYEPYVNDFDWSKINFPVSLNDMHKVEELVNYGINVYGYEDKSVHPLRITTRRDDKVINLLLIGSLQKGNQINHYVYIKKLDILVAPNKRNDEDKHTHKEKYTCVNCLHGFSTAERLKKHRDGGCDIFEPVKTIMPEIKKTKNGELIKPTIRFEHHSRKVKAPVAIYADFETLIQKYSNPHNESKSSTTKIADLPPCGYSFNIVSDYHELNMGIELYRGENETDDVVGHFLKNLCSYGDKIRKILNTEKKMIITTKQEKEFKDAKFCHICEKPFKEDDIKDVHKI
jgi:hypothetical protein